MRSNTEMPGRGGIRQPEPGSRRFRFFSSVVSFAVAGCKSLMNVSSIETISVGFKAGVKLNQYGAVSSVSHSFC